jgi:hypothetical protein
VIAILIIFLITGFTLAHFYLKCSVMTAFATFMAAIFGSIVAFNFYEMLANVFISRGYGGSWVPAGCFIVTFILGFALVRAVADPLVGAKIDFGNMPKVAVNIILGIVTGLFFSGHLLVGLGMLPVQGGWIYNRFPSEAPILSPNDPKTAFLNPDGMVSSLFSWFSSGSLSSSKSFAVLNADFVNRNHLNRYALKDEISMVCSPQALSVPGGSNKPVRTMELPGVGKVTVVRAHLAFSDISEGGARESSGGIKLMLAQMRMITKPSDKANHLQGKGAVRYPIGILENGKLVKKSLSEVIVFSSENVHEDRNIWIDLVFDDMPDDRQGVLLEFKMNALTKLPAPTASTAELENALNAGKNTSTENQPQEPSANQPENQ